MIENENPIDSILKNSISFCIIENFLDMNTTSEICSFLYQIHRQEYINIDNNSHIYGQSIYNLREFPNKYFDNLNLDLYNNYYYNQIVNSIISLFQENNYICRRIDEYLGKSYYPSVINNFNDGLDLHFDFAPIDLNLWEIFRNTKEQYSIIIPLTDFTGGETILYDREWKINDTENYKKDENYYSYSMDVVRGYPHQEIKHNKGNLIFF